MAKRYAVKPVLRPGRTKYVATFRQSSGKRTTRGLGTGDHGEAGLICAGLVRLWAVRPASGLDVPAGVHPVAVDLYFDGAPTAAADLVEPDAGPVLLDEFISKEEARALRLELTYLREKLEDEQKRRRALESSIVGRAAKAGHECPSIADALQRFAVYMPTATTADNARDVVNAARAFAASLPVEREKTVDILPRDIKGFLAGHTAKGARADKKAARRDAMRRRVGRFINWCADEWEYPSQMGAVKAVGRLAVRRERGDIHWHTDAEVQAALAGLADKVKRLKAWTDEDHARAVLYWRAVVGTLAYGGLQLAELVWLQKDRLETWTEKRRTHARFWITAEEDPTDPAVRHLLKTEHRRRHVNVHPSRLWPILKEYMAAGLAGEHYLFPIPAGRRRRGRVKAGGANERWITDTMGNALRGVRLGGGVVRPGLLPDGMTAASLRRTFGSLRLRDGRTTAEIAAEMGNTEEVVRTTYARILGREVRPD